VVSSFFRYSTSMLLYAFCFFQVRCSAVQCQCSAVRLRCRMTRVGLLPLLPHDNERILRDSTVEAKLSSKLSIVSLSCCLIGTLVVVCRKNHGTYECRYGKIVTYRQYSSYNVTIIASPVVFLILYFCCVLSFSIQVDIIK
jgi:hypothetical protein